MAKFNQFSSENILMSVCGHLLLIAVLVTAAKVVIDRAKLVTPDRIEIIEIDLDNVRVSGKETKLYNVGTPEKEQKQETKPVQKNPKKKISILLLKRFSNFRFLIQVFLQVKLLNL